MEIISLAFSPKIGHEGRFWLASGSRDKLITIFDTSQDYEAVTVLEHHTSSITSLQFSQQGDKSISLLSCSADKTIVKNEIDLKKVLGYRDFEQLQIAATHEKIFN